MSVLGVWDDHDYGLGNGDGSFKGKDRMKKLYLDFIDAPQDSVRRQAGRGIYEDYVITTEDGKTRVLLILLDVRYDYNGTSDERFGAV